MFSIGEDIFTKPIGDVIQRHVEYAESINGKIVMYCLVRGKYTPKSFENRFFVYPIRMSSILEYPFFPFRAFWTYIKQKHYKNDFNLIYTQDPFILATTGFIFRFFKNIPVLVGNHSNFIDNPRWLSERKLFRILNVLAKYNILKADACRVINTKEKEVYLKNRVSCPIYIVNTPVNVKKFNIPSDELQKIKSIFQGKNVILWAGRAVKVKNLKFWFDVAKLLIEKRDDIHFCVASDFSDPDFDIPRHVEKLGLEHYFTFTGFIPHEELAKYYMCSTLFLHTAFYEGFGKVYVEAMNYGLPIVTSNTSGAQDVIINNENGFIIDDFDVTKFVEKIELLLDNQDVYKRISENNIINVKENYNRDKNIQKLISIWKATAKLNKK